MAGCGLRAGRSKVAGGQWEHEHLYRTPGGRWVLNHWSQWQGSRETYRFITDDQARDWLLRNESDAIVEKWFGALAEESGPGRPEIGGAVHVRLGEELARVDAWADEQKIKRAEAVRRLVSAGLTAVGVHAG